MQRLSTLIISLFIIANVLAQNVHLELRDVSLAYALSHVDESFADSYVHFVIDDVEPYKVDVVIDCSKAVDAVAEVIGKLPFTVKGDERHIFVTSLQREQEASNPEEAIRSYYLQEVLVMESQSAFALRDNGISFSIEGTELQHRGNAIDLLTYLPGMSFGNGQIKLYDNSTPIVYIDDVIVDNVSELFSLRSEEISRITLLEAVNSTYHSQSGTVVKIYTRAPRLGWNAMASAEASKGREYAQSENVKLSWSSSHLQASGGVTYYDAKEYQIHSMPDFSPVICPRITSVNPSFQLISILNPNHRLGIKYEMMDILKQVSYWSKIMTFDGSPFDENDHYGLVSKSQWTLDYYPRHNTKLFYTGRWNKAQANFDLEYYTDRLDIIQEDLLVDDQFNSYHGKKVNGIDNNLLSQRLEVKIPMGKVDWSFGNEFTSTRRIDSYKHTVLGERSIDFERNEQQMSLFALASFKAGGVRMHAGLRNEYLRGETRSIVKNRDFSKNYFLPHIDMTIPLHSSQLSLSYSVRSHRPTYNQLNGYSRFNQYRLFVSANPDLKPSVNQSFNAQYKHKDLHASLKYQHISNYIANIIDIYDETYRMNYENIPSAEEVLVNVVYSPKFSNSSPILSSSLLVQDVAVNFESGTRHKYNTPVLFLDLHYPYAINPRIQFWCDWHYHTAGHVGTAYQHKNSVVNLGTTYQIGNLTLGMQYEDIFKSGATTFECYGDNLTYKHKSYYDTHRFTLTIQYHLK